MGESKFSAPLPHVSVPHVSVSHVLRLHAVGLAIAFLLLAGCSNDQPSTPTADVRQVPADSIDSALRESRVEDALRIARDALLQSPDDPKLLTDTARALAAAGKHREAADLLVEVAKTADFRPTSRVELAMRALLDLGEAYPAIDLLSQAIDSQPNDHHLRRLLFGLLGEAGRTDLMLKHYETIIRNRKFDLLTLLPCTDTSQRVFPPATIEALFKRNPDDHRIRLGMAQSLRDGRRFSDAETVLREIIQHHPEFSPAHALLGRMPSVQQSSNKDFSEWLDAALPHCSDQPDFWIAVGERHFHEAGYAAALSCYLAAARISPNMVVPWTQIGRSIRSIRSAKDQTLGLSDDVAMRLEKECDRRAQVLLDLRMHLQRFGGSDETSQQTAGDIARTLNKMGRHWEAEAWAAIATTLTDDKDPLIDELRSQIIVNLKQNQDWNTFPDMSSLDKFTEQVGIQFAAASPTAQATGAAFIDSTTELDLVDETEIRNLVVPKVSYPDLASSLIHSMGAGGGTIDFDLDGWSDVVLASAQGEPRDKTKNAVTVLRNFDGKFRNVSVEVDCRTGFGQGIAIGDYNEDGYPDIFCANVGENRLLRNNGDGTFTDATESLGVKAHQWTSCGAFVDMNGDSITDLIVVNYCDLNAAVDKPCKTNRGPAPCHPAKFRADNDQLLLGDGSGRFREAFSDSIGQITPGRGLGILAGSLTGASQSAFVANDMSANHLIQVTDEGLVESATPRGVAVDGQSFAQASMGIAYGDFDGDLDLDLYITGFAAEYNIYYEQNATGFWVDSTARQRLIEPTLTTVGFGTQAIDLDADGFEELAITNGHIGDFGPTQPPPAQPFQLMRRSKRGIFQLVDTREDTPYLSANHIGRALWKIDVDRDLADDLVVTHQNAAPVLLANRTKTKNRRIALQCVGTTSSRDAIGAVVKFVADGRNHAIWLLSGDGYMSSNERILKAGIGASEEAENVTVTWPNGQAESFGTINAGQTHVLVEGTGEAFAGG